MKKVDTYYCEDTPSEEELSEALQYAKNLDCYIQLSWKILNNWYHVLINPTDTLNIVKDKMPRIMYFRGK